jgi:hypothetical protein
VKDYWSEVIRTRKRPGKKSTNAKKAREAFGEDFAKEIPIPTCFDDYNQHMGGVDIADQFRSYYDTQLASFRMWWPMMFWGLDTMITNSYLIYSDPKDVPAMRHKEFRLQCAWGLILASRPPRSRQPRGHRAADRLQRSASILPYLLQDIPKLAICLAT